MREDMHEVIIERPRWGSRMRHLRRQRRVDPKHAARHDPDSLPLQKGLRRAAREGKMTKQFDDLLGPLKRYLVRQVNRPWNKVWSEISANLKATNTVQQHVRDHVLDIVAIKTSVRDGVVWVADHRSGRPEKLAECWSPLYVDPRTGILRVNKHYRRFARQRREMATSGKRYREARVCALAPMIEAHRLDDNWWWEIRLGTMPTERRKFTGRDGTPHYYNVTLPYFDVLVGTALTKLSGYALYGRDDVYAVAKRQLSREEIADLGLTA
jgi:hypothetical protein